MADIIKKTEKLLKNENEEFICSTGLAATPETHTLHNGEKFPADPVMSIYPKHGGQGYGMNFIENPSSIMAANYINYGGKFVFMDNKSVNINDHIHRINDIRSFIYNRYDSIFTSILLYAVNMFKCDMSDKLGNTDIPDNITIDYYNGGRKDDCRVLVSTFLHETFRSPEFAYATTDRQISTIVEKSSLVTAMLYNYFRKMVFLYNPLAAEEFASISEDVLNPICVFTSDNLVVTAANLIPEFKGLCDSLFESQRAYIELSKATDSKTVQCEDQYFFNEITKNSHSF